jgi:hypothetical protein
MKFKTIFSLIKNNILYILSFIILGVACFYIAAQLPTSYNILAAILNSCGATLITIGLLSSWIEILNAGRLIDMISLFGDHKDEGIERLFPGRTNDFYETRGKLLDACKVYKASTLVGRQYINNDDTVAQTIQLAEKCSEFEILFMDSSSTGYQYRYGHQEAITADVIGENDDKKLQIKTAQDAIKYALSKKANKTILHYSTLSPFNFEIIDDYLFVSFCGVKSRAQKSPILMLKKNKNSKTYEYFIDQYEQLRNESK